MPEAALTTAIPAGSDYSGRNFIRCQPGSLTKLDDGQMYRCQ